MIFMLLLCSKCQKEKEESYFSKAPFSRGYAYMCKSCHSEYMERWLKENGDKKKAYDREYAKLNSSKAVARMTKWKKMNPERRLFHGIKKKAKIRGEVFTITWNDINIPTHCPILGIPIVLTNTCTSGDSPSVDRIDNGKGYEPGNVRIISHRANTLKSNLTLEQAKRLALYMDGWDLR